MNIEVREVQDLQVVILIQKVEHPLEPLVGQWVGSVGFASFVQIDLGWVVVEEVGLG